MTTPGPPIAFSGSRLGWADLPRRVRRTIADLAHAEVVSESSATNGFSPGYASLLELSDGTDVFVKAVSPDQNPDSPALARAEIDVARVLPDGVDAPELLWSYDDGSWVILGFEVVQGRTPAFPWREDELGAALDALTRLADAPAPDRSALRPVTMGPFAERWARLAASGEDVDRAVAAVGEHGPWLRANLERLVTESRHAAAGAVGSSLVHGDLRADNMLVDTSEPGRVWLLDWPHAATDGARWLDLLLMLPSVAMQGGGDPREIFAAHPTAQDADPDAVRAVLTAVTGYLVEGAVQPPPPGIANLRPFQLAQGVAALTWLRAL